ncbi:MAG: hypothetical protein QGH41_10100, partial [Roseibacillus sp.]|nr:hypothetical protein [Roseibacillus sp.]
MKSSSLLLTIPLSLALMSCDRSNRDAGKDQGPNDSAPHALSAVLLTEPPEGAVTITQARQNPTPGTRVILSGKVMGNESPIIGSRALL